MSNPTPPSAADMQTLLRELDGLQEETDRSSFGSPATQGEIEAYEENKERILELVHSLMPYIRSLEADHKAMRTALDDMWEYYAPDGKGYKGRYAGGLSELEQCEHVLSSLQVHE